jgi:hypothetical protein
MGDPEDAEYAATVAKMRSIGGAGWAGAASTTLFMAAALSGGTAILATFGHNDWLLEPAILACVLALAALAVVTAGRAVGSAPSALRSWRETRQTRALAVADPALHASARELALARYGRQAVFVGFVALYAVAVLAAPGWLADHAPVATTMFAVPTGGLFAAITLAGALVIGLTPLIIVGRTLKRAIMGQEDDGSQDPTGLVDAAWDLDGLDLDGLELLLEPAPPFTDASPAAEATEPAY